MMEEIVRHRPGVQEIVDRSLVDEIGGVLNADERMGILTTQVRFMFEGIGL